MHAYKVFNIYWNTVPELTVIALTPSHPLKASLGGEASGVAAHRLMGDCTHRHMQSNLWTHTLISVHTHIFNSWQTLYTCCEGTAASVSPPQKLAIQPFGPFMESHLNINPHHVLRIFNACSNSHWKVQDGKWTEVECIVLFNGTEKNETGHKSTVTLPLLHAAGEPASAVQHLLPAR